MGRLDGKIAVIVGGGQTPGHSIGNGRATAIRFAEEGAKVLIVDRDESSAKETLDMAKKRGGIGNVFVADVTIDRWSQDLGGAVAFDQQRTITVVADPHAAGAHRVLRVGCHAHDCGLER